MDFTMKQWIIGIIVIVIVVIIIDGVRRMRNARRDSLHMSLDVKKSTSIDSENDTGNYGSEFPNGGARASQRIIDKKRIEKIKNQYDFGRDLTIEPRAINKQGVDQRLDNAEEPQHTTIASAAADDQEDSINSDQWVDSDASDEEYYAEKWDDEINEDDNNSTLENDDFVNDRIDGITLGDGNLGDEEEVKADAISTEKTAQIIERDVDVEMSAIPVQENATVKRPTPHKESYQQPYQQPEQVPLNLEESVPMLMESVIEDDTSPILHEDLNSVEDIGDVDVEVITAEDTLNQRADNPAEIDRDEVDCDDANRAQVLSGKAAKIRPVGRSVKPSTPVETGVADENNEVLDTHSANKPRYESKYFSNKSTEKPTEKPASIEEVLVVNVKTPKGTLCQGSDLLQQILDNGLRYGAMSIFHRHSAEDGEGPVIFSMANMLKPGTFDLQDIESFSTAGVTLFLTLPAFDDNNMAAFDLMITTAKNIANGLGGELNDENRSVMTGQTIEHYRERIRDFSRRQQLEKKR